MGNSAVSVCSLIFFIPHNRSCPACAFKSTHQFFQFAFTAIKLLRKFEPAGIIGLPIDIFKDQCLLILDRLLPQGLADALDRVEGPGHLVFFFQGSKASLGGVAFRRFFDNYRMGILRKCFNGNYRVTLIDNIFLHRGHWRIESTFYLPKGYNSNAHADPGKENGI